MRLRKQVAQCSDTESSRGMAAEHPRHPTSDEARRGRPGMPGQAVVTFVVPIRLLPVVDPRAGGSKEGELAC